MISEGDAKIFRAFLGAAARKVSEQPVKEGERIAKRLARAGLCSRRDAERWIEAGRVKVDGKVLETPAFVVTDKSVIEVDGKPLPAADRRALWRYHKPPSEMVTARDPRAAAPSSTRCPRACRGSSRSAGSTSSPKACCC